ncbi:hypothetical protein WJX77_003425 [Trebouxia sp. C0004]
MFSLESLLDLDVDQWPLFPKPGAHAYWDEVSRRPQPVPSTSDHMEDFADFIARPGIAAVTPQGSQSPQEQQQTTQAESTLELAVKPARPLHQRVRSREVNRRNQRSYREKKKSELQSLQAELDEMRQAMHHMQSDKQHLMLTMAQKANTHACSLMPVPHLPWQGPDVVDSQLLNQIMPIWRSGTIFTCSLTADQTSVVQQVSSLTPQQLAILWQGQIKDMALCLRSAGPDADHHPSGSRVEQLLNEYCCTNFVKARVDPLGHKALMAKAHFAPDPLAVAHVMEYSPSQKHAIFCIRRGYLQQLALITRCRQQLLQQLQAAPGALCTGIADLASDHLTVDDITRQLQGLLAEEHTAYMLYLRKVGHEISTVRQAAIAIVHPFPYTTDLIAVVDALAKEEGELSGEAFKAAADACEAAPVQDMTDKPDSINGAANRSPCATASDATTATDCDSAADPTVSARASVDRPNPSSMTAKALGQQLDRSQVSLASTGMAADPLLHVVVKLQGTEELLCCLKAATLAAQVFNTCKLRAKCQEGTLQDASGMDIVEDVTKLSAGTYCFTPAESTDTHSSAAWRLEVTQLLKTLLKQPSTAMVPQDFRVGSTQVNRVLASLEITEYVGNVVDPIVVTNQLRVAYEHKQSNDQKQRYREQHGDMTQGQIPTGALTYSGHKKGQSVIATLGAYAYNAWPLLMHLTDGEVHHLITIRNDELIYWDNLTPQQAYVKQSEILCSSATLMDRKLKMTSIPEDLQRPLKRLRELQAVTLL